jgi:2,4-dienoyl-CoA reductase (NADPH2)
MPSTTLFSPLTIRGVTLRNRIATSPMCQYSCVDGLATDWHLVHLGSRAIGGAGLVMVEATAVTAHGRISAGDMGLWNDQHIAPLARVAQFLQQHGAVPAIQLAHAGRKASCLAPWQGGKHIHAQHQGGWITVAPSALPFAESDSVPHALDKSEILAIKQSFVDAAKRAVQAGFKVIELHAAHGYLLHQFLSPLSNQRKDSWGGSLQNRMRLTIEVASAMRAAISQDISLWTRISATDWVDGGWNLEQSIALCCELKKCGVDLIDTSTGALVPYAKIPVATMFQVPFAVAIREQAKIMTGAVGMITEPSDANQLIVDGKADIVLLARAMLRDPYWALHAAEALHVDAAWPDQYAFAVKKR